MFEESYVYKKQVDWSALHQGINIPISIQVVFQRSIQNFILRGQSKLINILIDGTSYRATLVNQKFDQVKYPNRKDILQIRYNQSSEIAHKLRDIFSSSYSFLLQKRGQVEHQKVFIVVPDNKKEYLAIYTTEYPDTFLFDCFSIEDNLSIVKEVKQLTELDYENIVNLKDATSDIYLANRLVKIRKLNRAIGENLKILYENRCQICGSNFSLEYQIGIVEAHHIIPYTVSLNNNPNNILILCPNHHVVIHKANPVFDLENLSYYYDNGLIDRITLDKHLLVSRIS